MPARALVVLACGLAAMWLAAGSLGWLAPPLQKTLTWLALGTVVLLAFGSGRPAGGGFGKNAWLLAAAALAAVLMTASTLAVVNILAVALVLAAAATVRRDMISHTAGPAALAAVTLAIFRLVCDGTASGWSFANALGRIEGHWAALLTGRPLLIGASFGGVDFLVVMAALTVAWRLDWKRGQSPFVRSTLRAVPANGDCPLFQSKRVATAVLAIVVAQTAYLLVLACAHDLNGLLPAESRPVFTDTSRLGIWTWGNALHVMLPWHLPVLGAVLQAAVAAVMFRVYLPSPSGRGAGGEGDRATDSKKRPLLEPNALTLALSRRERGPRAGWQLTLPAGLLVLATAAVALMPLKPDLSGRRIVVYDDGATDWSTSDPGNVGPGLAPRYGLLPALVASLGGQFSLSKDLNAGDLRDAAVLIVLPPGQLSKSGEPAGEMPYEVRQRVWSFVRAGGRLIVAGEPETRLGVGENSLNALLGATAMSFRDDTANSLTERWENNLLTMPYAATATSRPGQGSFSIDRAASVRVAWPAGPLVVGRWCWNEVGSDPARPEALPYAPGSRLGDLVLAAQQNVGQGSVVVLGDATCLSNDGIPFSYTFCGPLLTALAEKSTTPLAWWRQLLALAAAVAAVVLLFYHFDTLRLAAAALALGLAAIACGFLNDATPLLLPSGTKSAMRPVIYIDGSHLEAMGKDPWREDGIGRFMRVLAQSGYLPLLAPEVSAARLKNSTMLVSIAPGRSFSESELADVKEFVAEGGNFLCLAGSPDAEPSQPMLDQFELHIGPMPVPPWKNVAETEPMGSMLADFRPDASIKDLPPGESSVKFHAAWPVSAPDRSTTWPNDDPAHRPVIAGNRTGQDKGQAFLIGDSEFALQKGISPPAESLSPDLPPPQNAAFWQTTLHDWLGPPEVKP